MASAMIHICVANEVNKVLKKEKYDFILGSIAPDLSKIINRTREESHFLHKEAINIPNTEVFLAKYKNELDNAYNLGYYIHLLADKYWFGDFLPNLVCSNSIKLIDGTIINTTIDEIKNLIYNDYTNLNVDLIDEYDLDLSLFYEEFIVPKGTIEEIPLEDLDMLIDKMGIIIENTKENKKYVFDMTMIKNFISDSVNKIIEDLKENNLLS